MLWGQGPIPLWNDCDVSVVENCDPPAPPPAVTMTPTPTVTPTPTEQPLPPQIDMLYLPIIDFRN